MFIVSGAPTRGVQRVRPRMRNVGLVHVGLALVLGISLVLGTMQACTGEDMRLLPSAVAMAVVIGVAGLAMTLRVPRATAVAPALAAGSALTLLGSSAAAWFWVRAQPCVGNVLDREAVTLLLVTASAVAVLATSLWLLVSRDELEPWQATRGVVLASGAAVVVFVLGVGFALLMRGTTDMPVHRHGRGRRSLGRGSGRDRMAATEPRDRRRDPGLSAGCVAAGLLSGRCRIGTR